MSIMSMSGAAGCRLPLRRCRKAHPTKTLTLLEPVKMKKDMIVGVEKPEIREHSAFRVLGLSAKAGFEVTSAIPALWSEFNAREDAV